MDVSSSTSSQAQTSGSTQVDALKKSINVQERAVQQVIESATEQSKQVAAQKTGMGNGVDLTA